MLGCPVVYIQLTALRRNIAMARCKEAKFKVAKRDYLQICPANFLCYVNLSTFRICKI